ncbi:MAG: VOC family protein [Anaerolineales bacterium]|nr:VOC family protein [Anaerolineales bacterium]
MENHLGSVAFLVSDYDEAINYFVSKLGFKLQEDTDLGEGKRWVLVSPESCPGTCLLLAKADSPAQESHVGNQTGGRVFLFLHTKDFWKEYNNMKKNGVEFVEKPRQEVYGTVVVFRDLYGNHWDLIQMKE